MKLLLASSTIPSDYLKQLPPSLLPSKTAITVGFIATAADLSTDKWYVQKAREEIIALGLQIQEVDLKNQNANSLYTVLSVCDIIYVSGGNTFYLLDWVRKSGFDLIIRQLLAEGKIYASSSAGSYIACPTIETATWKDQDTNTIGLKNLTGMGFVPFLIFAHFEEQWRHMIEMETKRTSYPLVALHDGQAITVLDDDIKVIGDGERTSYNGFGESV